MRRLAAALTVPIVLVLTLLVPSQAQAQADGDSRWVKRVLRTECDFWGNCYRRYHYQRVYRQQEAYYGRRAPQVRSYIQRADDERGETGWCRDTRRVVGNQHLTVAGAKNEADKAWIQSIRFYFGEVFMDMSNARDIKYTCSRSSVGETLGQTFNRCELEARPCKAPAVQSAEESK